MQNTTVTLSCKRIHAAMHCKLTLLTSFAGFLFQKIVCWFSLGFFFATTSKTTTTWDKKILKIRKKNLLLIMPIYTQCRDYMREREEERESVVIVIERKMNNYCTGTDFMKWNESFAAILAIMWRWNANHIYIGEKYYVDKHIYIITQYNTYCILCIFMCQNKTKPKVNHAFCEAPKLIVKCTVSMVTFVCAVHMH